MSVAAIIFLSEKGTRFTLRHGFKREQKRDFSFLMDFENFVIRLEAAATV